MAKRRQAKKAGCKVVRVQGKKFIVCKTRAALRKTKRKGR